MHTHRFAVTALMTLATIGPLSGCVFGGDATEDPVTFEFTQSRGCATLFGAGCPATGPVLVGVHESLRVRVPRGRDPQGNLTVRSLDPDVVQVSSPSPTVGNAEVTYQAPLETLREGVATVVLQRADGSVVDRTRVTVAAAQGLDVVNDEPAQATLSADGSALVVRLGRQASITGYATGAQGVRLHGNDGVVWTVADRNVAELSFGLTTGSRIADDHVYVLPRAVGETRVTVVAGAQSRTLTLTVTE